MSEKITRRSNTSDLTLLFAPKYKKFWPHAYPISQVTKGPLLKIITYAIIMIIGIQVPTYKHIISRYRMQHSTRDSSSAQVGIACIINKQYFYSARLEILMLYFNVPTQLCCMMYVDWRESFSCSTRTWLALYYFFTRRWIVSSFLL